MSIAPQTGYVSAAPKASLTARARRSPLLFVGVALFIAILAVLITQSRPNDYQMMSIDNFGPDGTHATAQILRDQGVAVRQVGLLSDAHIDSPATTTLVIANPTYLMDTQLGSIASYPGDVVFLGVNPEILDSVDQTLALAGADSGAVVDADCAGPDAAAAAQTTMGYDGIGASADTPAVLCFTDSSGASAYAKVETANGTRTLIANPEIATNKQLDKLGNAALTLRAAGHHESVLWYLGGYTDSSLLTWGDGGPTPTDVDANPNFMPPGTTDALFALGLAALVAAFWRARRFGPLVTEPLPVVVRSSEATRGRARLYRRARATGRATAALRGIAAMRIGARLGVPRAAGRAGLVPAIARATGRPAPDIDAILYGPPPTDEAGMNSIAQQLDTLESEVHRP